MKFVQNITSAQGVAITPTVENGGDEDTILGFHLEYGSNQYCEFKNEDDTPCSKDKCLWQADDMSSPYTCTNHFFGVIPQSGWEFIER